LWTLSSLKISIRGGSTAFFWFELSDINKNRKCYEKKRRRKEKKRKEKKRKEKKRKEKKRKENKPDQGSFPSTWSIQLHAS
jgi:hypothetical protein